MTEPRQPSPPPPPPPEPEIVEWGTPPRSAGGPLAWLASRGWRVPGVVRGLVWLPAGLAGLGGLALFGSLVDTWQVTRLPEEATNGQLEEVTAQLPGVGAWGTGWLVGVSALAVCAALAVLGPPALRVPARSIGLAIVGAQAALLVAAGLHLRRNSVLESLFGLNIERSIELEAELGRGVYAGFLGLALVAAALWRVRPDPPVQLDPSVQLDPRAWADRGTPAPAPAAADATGTAGAGEAPAAAVPTQVPAPVRGSRPPAPAGRPEPGPDEPPDLAVGPAEPFTHPGDHPTWR